MLNVPAHIWLIDKKNIETSNLEEEILPHVRNHAKVNEKPLAILGNALYIIQFLPTAEKKYLKRESLRKAGGNVCKLLNEYKAAEATLHAPEISEKDTFAFAEGIRLASYHFGQYLDKTAEKKARTFTHLHIPEDCLSQKLQSELHTLSETVFLTRDLVNKPLNKLNAVQYAEEIKALGSKYGFSVTVFDKKKIEELKMGGVLAVNHGSITDPVFIIMEYKPGKAENDKPLVLVGKGVMYDTGGLSLKPTHNSMDYMKCDMAGSAAVVGGICALAGQGVPAHVIGLIPAVENRPGGDAITPGDIITQYDGTTVEILNTDAEGRLILADALSYAKQYNPALVMDFATLTGSAMRAIGTTGTVFMGTADKDCRKLVKKVGKKTGERMVKFPLWDEFGEMIDSEIADIKNLGGENAGAITAGKFLQHFTDYPWLHFDIAGPAFLKTANHYRPVGGTGVGVRFIYNFAKQWLKHVAEERED